MSTVFSDSERVTRLFFDGDRKFNREASSQPLFLNDLLMTPFPYFSIAPNTLSVFFCASVNPLTPVIFKCSYGLSPLSVFKQVLV